MIHGQRRAGWTPSVSQHHLTDEMVESDCAGTRRNSPVRSAFQTYGHHG